MTIRMHKKIKITVLRTEYYQELAEQYAIPNLGKCPFHPALFLPDTFQCIRPESVTFYY